MKNVGVYATSRVPRDRQRSEEHLLESRSVVYGQNIQMRVWEKRCKAREVGLGVGVDKIFHGTPV